MLDSDLKQSLVLLENKITVLEAYTALVAPGAEAAAPAADAGEAQQP